MNHWMSIIRFLGGRLVIYLAAVLIAYLLATISATQSVIFRLGEIGVNIGFGQRLAMTTSDIQGMAGMFLPMVAFGMLIAFMVTALICRYLHRWRTALYVIAGAAAIICIHLALELAFGITPVAIARTTVGLLVQGFAGAVGGLTYVFLSNRFSNS